MGRPAKPAAEKAMTGAGRRPTPSDKPAAASAPATFAHPEWLTRSDARAVWRRVVPGLARFNIMTEVFRDVVGRYCQHFAEWVKVTKQIDRQGVTTLVPMTNGQGNAPRQSAIKVRNTLEKALLDIEDRFGISPLARYKIVAHQAAIPGQRDLFRKTQSPDPSDARNRITCRRRAARRSARCSSRCTPRRPLWRSPLPRRTPTPAIGTTRPRPTRPSRLLKRTCPIAPAWSGATTAAGAGPRCACSATLAASPPTIPSTATSSSAGSATTPGIKKGLPPPDKPLAVPPPAADTTSLAQAMNTAIEADETRLSAFADWLWRTIARREGARLKSSALHELYKAMRGDLGAMGNEGFGRAIAACGVAKHRYTSGIFYCDVALQNAATKGA